MRRRCVQARSNGSPIGSNGFGMAWVNGRNRSPKHPAKMTAFMVG
jgi:hypothetical protein